LPYFPFNFLPFPWSPSQGPLIHIFLVECIWQVYFVQWAPTLEYPASKAAPLTHLLGSDINKLVLSYSRSSRYGHVSNMDTSYVPTKFSYISSKKKLYNTDPLYYGQQTQNLGPWEQIHTNLTSILWTLRDKVLIICSICTISCQQLHKHWHFISQRYQYQNMS